MQISDVYRFFRQYALPMPGDCPTAPKFCRQRVWLRLLLVLIAAPSGSIASAQLPVPHELRGHKAITFRVPRTRTFDWEYHKYFGGAPDLEQECGGATHCWGRPAVWRCYEYIIPPETPRWEFDAEFIAMMRDREDGDNIIFRVTDDEPLFSMNDFGFDFEAGYRLIGQFNLTPMAGFEVIYHRNHDGWSDRVITDDLLPMRLELFGLEFISAADPFETFYETRFQSGEANFRRYLGCGDTSIIAGFRWLEIDELFTVGVQDSPVQARVETQNRLLGFQLGAEARHWVNYGILRLDASLKGGIYQNLASNRASLNVLNVDLLSAGTEDDLVTWVGESRVGFALPLSKNCFLRAGYELIHISGLAVAADQINSISVLPPQLDLSTDGHAIYHGYFVGLEAWW
jgi:hypothetical protein